MDNTDNQIQPANELDNLYKKLLDFPEAEMPLHHAFLPGIYVRQIFMPAGTAVISRIHKFTHPYYVSKGKLLVWHNDGAVLAIEAPHAGITQAGTQRVLYILEDTVWTTMHITDLTDPDAIVKEITLTPDEGSITIKDMSMLKQLQEVNS